jgi:hypothetical protein
MQSLGHKPKIPFVTAIGRFSGYLTVDLARRPSFGTMYVTNIIKQDYRYIISYGGNLEVIYYYGSSLICALS